MKQDNVIRQKSYDFALKIIKLHRSLVNEKEFILSKQLLRSGTSVGANIEEAQAAQSRADFISKMSIASKEARESCYWLRLLRDSNILEKRAADTLLTDADSIVRILTSIVMTTSQAKNLKSKIQNQDEAFL